LQGSNKLDNKGKQMQRMWQYFVDATVEIIEEEGVQNVTIRKIADKAGYNSATIYNYFQEVSHVIFFAALRYLQKYLDALPQYMSKGKDSLERYLLSWELFCIHSFREPEIYNAIFLANLGDRPEELLEHYYSVYQADLIDELPDDVKKILVEYNLSKRSRAELEKSVEQGLIHKEDVHKINVITVTIWQGMLTTILNKRRNDSPEEAAKITTDIIKEVVNNYRIK
jgi:AcrR family transcriptional regulator